MESDIRFRLLGPVQITRDGEPVHGFESHKALALVCYLAELGRPASRGSLAGLFWGAKSENHGRANLSRVLHNNSALLPGCLQADRDQIRFVPSSARWVDSVAFADLAARGDVASLTAAANLYRGDLMEGMSLGNCPEFETWLVTEQELWRQRMAHVLHSLIAFYKGQGNYKQGLNFASRLLALDPWREEAHRQTMLMLALSGERTAALVQYETCRRILNQELGVEPGEETVALYNRIRAGKAVSPAPPHDPQPRWVPPADRERDLAQIVDRLDNPTCRLLTLVNPAGNCQDRLAQQAALNMLDRFRHGVYFVPAANVHSTGSLVSAVAQALRLPLDNRENPPVQLINHLREKDALLVIGDWQHFAGGAELLEDILKRAPRVKFLVTSSEPVDLCAECIFDTFGP